eukprot:36842-Prorocentrum_lima.AAC.1
MQPRALPDTPLLNAIVEVSEPSGPVRADPKRETPTKAEHGLSPKPRAFLPLPGADCNGCDTSQQNANE